MLDAVRHVHVGLVWGGGHLVLGGGLLDELGLLWVHLLLDGIGEEVGFGLGG